MAYALSINEIQHVKEQIHDELVAKAHPESMFVLDCDIAPSTKLAAAMDALDGRHKFQLSIEEQLATMMANGLSVSTPDPKLVVFATFAAFFEGIAREGFEMWRYQRNLNGANEGLNVTFHLSHVGSCTGRDHFSGWSLDWINLAIGYLPYLDRFYAPADARSAFVAIRDLAARNGAHIIGVPRDNLPILTGPDGAPVWENTTAWTDASLLREQPGYARFRAHRQRHIWGCNLFRVPFFEDGAFHPERILSDLVHIAHPHADEDVALHYFSPLHE